MTGKTTPKYRRQKSKTGDRAFVEINGQKHYLGAFDSSESHERYARLITEWRAGGGQLPVPSDVITIKELVARYWAFAQGYYRRADGTQTVEVGQLRQAFAPLCRLYGSTTAASFGPRALKAVREHLITKNLSRKYINDQISRVRRLFKWGVEEELVPALVFHAHCAVPGLKRGRSAARETEPVRPVPEEHIEAVRPKVSQQVWAMIELQRFTACRAGEVVRMRPIDLETTGHVWRYTLDDHKNSHRGHTRTIYLGPRSQEILRPFLSGCVVESFLFSPRDAETERHARAKSHRRPDQQANASSSDRTLGNRYTVDSYRRAVQRACKVAGVPLWSPSQLRHNAGTSVRESFGLEGSQLMLGHKHAAVSEIYAEINRDKAVAIAARFG